MRNLLLASALLLPVLPACLKNNSGGATTDTATGALDSSESVEAEGNLMMASVDGAEAALVAPTAEQVAAHIAGHVGQRWTPAGCATAVATGASVTVTYNDCAGPRGLLHVTGTLDLTAAVAVDGAISVHGTATDLHVNKATLTVDTDATYTTSATSHALAVQTTGTGTGPRGNAIDHQGDYTISWDPATTCRTLAGHWSTEITGAAGNTATRSNDVNLTRCVGACPSGTVTHHFLAGASLTVTFDGTPTATWTTSAGGSGTVALSCP